MTDTVFLPRAVLEHIETLLELNISTFTTYTELHSAKGSSDGDEKAERNRKFAEQTKAGLDHLRRSVKKPQPHITAVELAFRSVVGEPVGIALSGGFARGLYQEVCEMRGLLPYPTFESFRNGRFYDLPLYVSESNCDTGVLIMTEGSCVLDAARQAYPR